MKDERSPFGAFGIYDLPKQEWLCISVDPWEKTRDHERLHALVLGITTYGTDVPHVRLGHEGWIIVKVSRPSEEEMRLMQEWD